MQAIEQTIRDLLLEPKEAELSRTLKHSDFVEAIRTGAPLGTLAKLRTDVDKLSEKSRLCAARIVVQLATNPSPEANVRL